MSAKLNIRHILKGKSAGFTYHMKYSNGKEEHSKIT